MNPRIAAQLNDTPSNTELRITPNNFDLVRLLAASQVVVVHGIEHLELTSIVNQHFAISWHLLTAFPGVPIFFVVSGYLISRSLDREPCLRSYAVNRMLRIYPALIACFLVSVLSVLVVSPKNILTADPLRFTSWTIAQLTFFQFYNPDFLRSYGVGTLNGSLWTIPVELQFYIILPITYLMLGLRTSKKLFNSITHRFIHCLQLLHYFARPQFPLRNRSKAPTSFVYTILLDVSHRSACATQLAND